MQPHHQHHLSISMNLLLIATGFLPYAFSENICNGKLVLCLRSGGFEVDVISRVDEGPSYSREWVSPWKELQTITHEVQYRTGNKMIRAFDTARAAWELRSFPIGGIRWARRAYKQALDMCRLHSYDAVLTRSPNDVAHLVGRALKHKLGIKWLANWNDPAATIWPGSYSHKLSPSYTRRYNELMSSCMKMADVNTFPSIELCQHFKNHFDILHNRPCKIVPHATLPTHLFPKRHYCKSDVFRICHSGNLSPERDPRLFLQAMKQAGSETGVLIHLDIMGIPNPFVKDIVEEHRMSDQVSFIGNYPYEEALSRLTGYDILLLQEAKLDCGIFFPSKLTDYAQTGRPTLAVSPKDGYANRVISQFGGGICVDNNSKEDITRGLRRMIEAWKTNTLDIDFSTNRLLAQYSYTHIVDLYKEMLP